MLVSTIAIFVAIARSSSDHRWRTLLKALLAAFLVSAVLMLARLLLAVLFPPDTSRLEADVRRRADVDRMRQSAERYRQQSAQFEAQHRALEALRTILSDAGVPVDVR